MHKKSAPRCKIDFLAPNFVRDPYSTYKLLREQNPVCQLSNGTYVLSRYKDVQFALKHHNLFKSGWVASSVGRPTWLAESCQRGQFLAEVDPPEQPLHRAIINKSFTVREINRLEPLMRQKAENLAFKIKSNSGNKIDFLKYFSYPFVGSVIGEMIGLGPDHDIERTLKWIEVWEKIPMTCPEDEKRQEIESIINDQNSYYDEIVRDRRLQPRNDLVSALANATVKGNLLTGKQLHAALSLITIGGFSAPAQLLCRAVILLSRRPDLTNILRDKPENIRPFIEELIRFDSSFQATMRVTATPVTLHGITVPANSTVLLFVGSANRDPSQFSNPDEFQLSRHNAKSHLGFSQGIHACIGASLARMEMRISLEVLLKSFQKFYCPADADLDWSGWLIARPLKSLPVRLD